MLSESVSAVTEQPAVSLTEGAPLVSNIRREVEELGVSPEISGADYMLAGGSADHYFSVGRSALRLVTACITARGEYEGSASEMEKILDFGCGYGRVCRYLRAGFPEANISVADVNKDSVKFCVETFNCTDIGDFPEPESFDLIWVGSVFTHLAEPAGEDLLYKLVEALRPNGILVFTTHGRFSYAMHYIDPRRQHYIAGRLVNDRIAAGYLRGGFGFVEHPGQDEGISIIDPHWVQQRLFASTGLVQVFFQERAWDFHQDGYGFVRRELVDA